jgi:protein involved in polysaccharide export with SLBB domain
MNRLLTLLLFASAAYAQTDPPNLANQYRIQYGDTLSVTVQNHPEWSARVTVPHDGTISPPMIGATVATGKTPQQLAHELEQVLIGYGAPKVTVIVGTASGARHQDGSKAD